MDFTVDQFENNYKSSPLYEMEFDASEKVQNQTNTKLRLVSAQTNNLLSPN